MIQNTKRVSLFCRWLGLYFLTLVTGALGLGAFGSLLKIIAAVPVGIWAIKRHTVCLNRMVKATGIFVLFCTLSCIWSINMGKSISRSESHILFLIMLFSCSAYDYNKNEIEFLKRCLVNSSRITAVILLLTGTYGDGRLLLSGIITEDPNYLCAYFMFGAVEATSILLSSNATWRLKVLSIIEMALYVYIVFATGSRGGLFAVAAVVIVPLLFFKEKKGVDIKLISKRIVLSIVILISITIVTSFLPVQVAARFTATAISESNGTGRYELWADAINAFSQSTILRRTFGYGTGTIMDVTYLFVFSRHNVMHNVFVENLIEIGIGGLCTYIAFVISYIATTVKQKNLFATAVIAGMIVLSLSTSIYTFKPYWNIMLFIACCANSTSTGAALNHEN